MINQLAAPLASLVSNAIENINKTNNHEEEDSESLDEFKNFKSFFLESKNSELFFFKSLIFLQNNFKYLILEYCVSFKISIPPPKLI